ncbi:MAG: hypothetical protein UX42_C0006G0050 [Microgenomates group bacterium GW2011_GWC1_46_20]|nr:MAG: hypothetical protein UX00_C0011G0014 [Microgenomates group bacterium GW2011_GWB1_45_17]KKU28898.1 MAG: hypothetical protein UX42_C0006G0050 [Microgenomates group bacterium GW2011_GWC1_46_20]
MVLAWLFSSRICRLPAVSITNLVKKRYSGIEIDFQLRSKLPKENKEDECHDNQQNNSYNPTGIVRALLAFLNITEIKRPVILLFEKHCHIYYFIGCKFLSQ